MSALPEDIERVALLGWRVHPASAWSRAACFTGATDTATCDLDQLERWACAYPGCNWRVVMQGSGIWALDLDAAGEDHAADGIAAFRCLAAPHGELPARPMLRSGGGGLALFWRDTGRAICGRTGWPAPGIDPRRGRLSQTIPPSRHHRTGCPYRWLLAPWEVDPPAAPEWLLRAVAPPPDPPLPQASAEARNGDPDRARSYALGALRNSVVRVAGAPQGQRNDQLNRAAWSLSRFIKNGALSPQEIAQGLAGAALRAGLSRPEVQQTLRSALSAGAAA